MKKTIPLGLAALCALILRRRKVAAALSTAIPDIDRYLW